ncbi:Transporter associated domain protein [compost metagenome]
MPEEEKERYHTLSGMLLLLLGRLPQIADRVEWGDWRFEIVDMDGKRIDKVLASRLPPEDGPEEETTG